MAAFNALNEPWIPAADRATGQVREYGILELLERAHELGGIADPAPPIQLGLYRLLIAFVMDALALHSPAELTDRIVEGRFDMAAIREYVEQVGAERFDLFDSETPFLQTPVAEAKPKPVANLLPHLPSGSFAIHFHHWLEGSHAFSPAVCARALTAVAPFMTAGGAGYSPSINGAPPWYVLVLGENLFETLLLNCYTGETPSLAGNAGPAWRSDKSVMPKADAICDSLPEGLTWRPRIVRLIPGEGGTCTYSGQFAPVLVREMYFGPGLAFAGRDSWTDPNVAYWYSAKGRSPLRPQEERELWREIGALFLLRKAEHGEDAKKVACDRPWVIDQFRRLREEYGLFRQRRFEAVEVYGLRTDGKMKVFEWQCGRLNLPVGVGQNRQAPGQVRTAIETAESVAWCIKAGLTDAYPRKGEGNQKAFGRLIQEAQRQYWACLENRFWSEVLEPLAVQDPDDEAARRQLLTHWGETIKQEAGHQFEAALAPLDTDAKSLMRQALARDHFRKLLAGAALPPEVRAQRKQRAKEAANHGG